MPSFFLEYSPALVFVMVLTGFLAGMLLGYLFWGIYRGRAKREQHQVELISADLKHLRAKNRDLKTQLARRS